MSIFVSNTSLSSYPESLNQMGHVLQEIQGFEVCTFNVTWIGTWWRHHHMMSIFVSNTSLSSYPESLNQIGHVLQEVYPVGFWSLLIFVYNASLSSYPQSFNPIALVLQEIQGFPFCTLNAMSRGTWWRHYDDFVLGPSMAVGVRLCSW